MKKKEDLYKKIDNSKHFAPQSIFSSIYNSIMVKNDPQARINEIDRKIKESLVPGKGGSKRKTSKRKTSKRRKSVKRIYKKK